MSENDPIRAFQHELAQLSEQAEALRPTVRACQDAVQRADKYCLVSVRQRLPRILGIDVTFFAESLSDVTPVIRELAKEGIRSRDKSHEDFALLHTIAQRTYRLTETVHLIVFLIGDTCKLEQTGTKEVPVYELRCGSTVEAETPRQQIPATN